MTLRAAVQMDPMDGVNIHGDSSFALMLSAQARGYARALAQRKGPILPLITDHPDHGHAVQERHTCIDTTASGGNAQLLAEVGG